MTTSRLCWLALVVVYLALVSCASQPPEAPAEPAPTASQQGQPAETSQPAQKVQNEALPKGVFDSLARKLPENLPALSFREVARQSGILFVHSRGERSSLLPEDMGSGAAWGDYNNDGHPDLYLVNQPGPLASAGEQDTEAGSDKLYRNNGDGTFTEVTAEAGLGGNGFGMGAFWGDYDRDGCLDLYVTNYGKSALYHNNCDGTFRDVTERAGVANNRWATSALWFDYDRDGRLDLYVCNYVDFDPARLPRDRTQLQYGINVPFTLNPVSFEPQPNRLYHNNGDGIFTDVAVEAGVADPQGRSLVVTFADFDLDAWPDLYIGNDISANSLFRNRGNGRFEDVSASSGTEEYRGTMGIGLGDFDADGDQDFFLTHWVAQANALYQNLYLELGSEAKNRLFFGDVADMEGLGSISMNDVSWGTGFFDFDNDGRLDLVVINGSTLENPGNRKLLQRQKSRLFWNQGTTGFYDIASVAAAPLQRPMNGRGLAAADYDNDGDVDLVVTTNRGPALLLRNDGGHRRRWLKLRLRAVQSPPHGIGTKLRVSAGSLRLYAEVGAGGSYLSQSFTEAHFGLGEHKTIDRLELLWPSGVRQVFLNVATNRALEVVESGPEAGLRALQIQDRP